jgi:hypothetical protein
MTTAYFQDRLQISLDLMNAANDPCARVAHEGMVRGYRALVAARGPAEAVLSNQDLAGAPARDQAG